MKRILLAASLALALASTAFAQDSTSSNQGSSSVSSDQPVAADSQSAMNSDGSNMRTGSQQSAPAPSHRHHHRHMAQQKDNHADTALSGNEPKVIAYQQSDRMKSYPAVDHGHVAGDPPVIDHSGDQASVPNPTRTAITVPPTR